MNECFVGIDVSKARVDVYVSSSDALHQYPSDEAGMAALQAELVLCHPQLIELEATGGLERAWVAVQLLAAGLPVAVVNPCQMRDFAKATGRLTKTDRIDARVLAHFASAVRPVLRDGARWCPKPSSAT